MRCLVDKCRWCNIWEDTIIIGLLEGRIAGIVVYYAAYHNIDGICEIWTSYNHENDGTTLEMVPPEIFDFNNPDSVPHVAHSIFLDKLVIYYDITSNILLGLRISNSSHILGIGHHIQYSPAIA